MQRSGIIKRFALLLTHKASDEALDSAVTSFYEDRDVAEVEHTTHSFGSYRITVIKTTFNGSHTSRRLARRRKDGDDEIPSNTL